MKLALITIITEQFERMTAFYKGVLEIVPDIHRNNYAEFELEQCGRLSLWRKSEAAQHGLESMHGGSNSSVLFEMEVNDVEEEYARLSDLQVDWVQGPTVQPWNDQTIYFRDPDGNMISFFSDYTPEEGNIYGA